MQEGTPKKIAAVIISVAFNAYLTTGALDGLPSWFPLAVMLIAGLYWVWVDPHLRASFKTETGRIIHPGSNKPAQLPRVRRRKAVITIVVVLVVASLLGGIAWKFRAKALAVVGHDEFVFSGAYHSPLGGPEEFLVTAGCSIHNGTRHATGITNWRASLKFKDGRIVEGYALPATDKDMPIPLADSNLQPLSLKATDYLPIKALQPIPPGGGTYGWFLSVFKGYTRKDVRGKGVVLIIQFNEIATGEQHAITVFLDTPEREVPGIFRIRKMPGT